MAAGMGLSKDAVKNLLDVLRTVNLSATAISFGLISNVVIAQHDVSVKAREELQDLLRIKSEIGHYSAWELIDEKTKESGLSSSGDYLLSLSIDPEEKFLPRRADEKTSGPSLKI